MDLSEYLVKYPIAFVAVSLGNEPDLITAIVTSQTKLPIQKAYVVSFEHERCRKVLNDMKYKDQDIKVICYNDIELGDLHGVKNSVIGFDNLSFLMEFAELDMKRGFEIIEYLKKNGNWILIFGTQKTLPLEIKKFEEKYPKAHMFDDRFANFGHNVVYSINKTKMTREQEMRYNLSEKYWIEVKKYKPDEHSWKKDEFPNLKKFCNITFPGSIQGTLESSKLEEKLKIPTPTEIIDTFGISTILENSPKFQQLIDNIVVTRRQRHLVHTAYGNYFGTKMIQALLTNLEIPSVVLDYEQADDINEANLKLFNTKENYIVLITNIIPPEDPINIHMYHIMDSELLKSFEILFQIYKYKNLKVESTKIPKLSVELYACSKLDSKSIDDVMFDEFYFFLTNQQKFWDMVVNSSMHIVTNDKFRLSVVV